MKTIKEIAAFELEETSDFPGSAFILDVYVCKLPGMNVFLSEHNLFSIRRLTEDEVFVYWVEDGLYGWFYISKEVLYDPDGKEFILDEIESQKINTKQRK